MRSMFLAVVFLFGCAPSFACTIRFGNETSFLPFIEFHDNKWQGLTVELLQMLVQDIGCQLEFIPSPWLRSLKLIDKAELDVLAHLTYNTERETDFAFIGPHHLESIYLIATSGNFVGVTQLEQLRNYRTGLIALLNGAYYGDELALMLLDERTKDMFISIVSNQDKMLLLVNGRVQGVMDDIMAFNHWRTVTGKQVRHLRAVFKVYESPVYFGFNRKTLTINQLEQLAKAWQARFDDGTVQRILDKYQGTEPYLTLPPPNSLL
ncbi:substrate-binding periplasmic protein [Alishewanella sp. d11]|uniref:substrate-binding periplasmic protein n=1 Tax=Alishewanella sp. d11 TaxID=3414030 RepID=UPI003BF822E0